MRSAAIWYSATSPDRYPERKAAHSPSESEPPSRFLMIRWAGIRSRARASRHPLGEVAQEGQLPLLARVSLHEQDDPDDEQSEPDQQGDEIEEVAQRPRYLVHDDGQDRQNDPQRDGGHAEDDGLGGVEPDDGVRLLDQEEDQTGDQAQDVAQQARQFGVESGGRRLPAGRRRRWRHGRRGRGLLGRILIHGASSRTVESRK